MRFLVALIALFTAASISYAQDTAPNMRGRLIIIEPGKSDGIVSNAELLRRINRLEQAVQQLQDKVFELSRNQRSGGRIAFPPVPPLQPIQPAPSAYTCFIETTFRGTFMETAPTETAAKASVLKKCHDGDGGLDCTERKVKCGR